jgi:putative ABC transport system substrate-binding protein
LVVVYSPLFRASRQQIVDLAAATRLPAISGDREYAAAGGLMAYGPSLPDLWRRTASYVDRILKGAKPADLPVEQPTQFELVINTKTAKALGLAIPPAVLQRADRLIE